MTNNSNEETHISWKDNFMQNIQKGTNLSSICAVVINKLRLKFKNHKNISKKYTFIAMLKQRHNHFQLAHTRMSLFIILIHLLNWFVWFNQTEEMSSRDTNQITSQNPSVIDNAHYLMFMLLISWRMMSCWETLKCTKVLKWFQIHLCCYTDSLFSFYTHL